MRRIAAKKLGRPVKWISDRNEHFLIDAHGRDNFAVAEMAMDENGRFLAMRVDLLANMGAYLSQYGPFIPEGGLTMLTGLYEIPNLYALCRGIYTHTIPVDAYRGAGRPEAAYLVERLVDQCGRDTGLGPVEIRRRNFIPTGIAALRDPGRPHLRLAASSAPISTRALEVADWKGFDARAAEAKANGKVRGFGIGTYVEACAFPGKEEATVRLNDDGSVTVFIGTQTNGQGHATAYAQFVAGHMGLDYDKIHVVQGDTDQVPNGEGTGGSRSIPLGAVSVNNAAVKLADQVKQLAADQLEAAVADLELVERQRPRRRHQPHRHRSADSPRRPRTRTLLTAFDDSFEQPEPTYPNGTHIAEVEIDPETGVIEIVNYVIVDDFGATVNPILLEGQVHGGIVQGIGQALYENTVYDADGQLLTASFLDYTMPRADGVPSFSVRDAERAVEDQRLRHQGRRRGRLDRLMPGGDERHPRRAQPRLRRHRDRHAGDAGEGLERDRGREG